MSEELNNYRPYTAAELSNLLHNERAERAEEINALAVAVGLERVHEAGSILAAVEKLAADALSRPAPAVQVPVGDGWIPVGDRLPEFDAGYVLVHCEGGKVGDDFFCRNREFLRHAGNRYSRKVQGKESGYFRSAHEYGYRVTHWQPLPAAPAIAKQGAQDGR